MRKTSRFFKALSDQTRLKILWLLFRRGQASLREVEHVLGISQARAVNHMKYLMNAGVVRVYGAERTVYAVMQQTDPFRRATLEGLKCQLCEAETAVTLERRLAEWSDAPAA
jgi:DNA-binding transcriptional ArsR family regulator